MPLVDDRGRLFGKVNIIDAAVAVLALILLPLGYGAYVLFREPLPTISSVQPATLIAGQSPTIVIQGKNLRPFMKAKLGTRDAQAFLIQSPSQAEIKLPPDLAPGTYDVALLDELQELTRRARALTVVPPSPPPPPPTVPARIRGIFTNLTTTEAHALAVGLHFSDGGNPVAEVRALQPPEQAVQRIRMGPDTIISNPIAAKVQVPAILDIRCTPAPDGCRFGGAVVDRNATLQLTYSGATIGFTIDEVRSAASPVAFPPPPIPLPPDTVVRAVGTFTALDAAQARELREGMRFTGTGEALAEVLSVDHAEPALQPVRVGAATVVTPLVGRNQVHGVIRVRCTPAAEGCKVGDTVLARNVTLTLRGAQRVFRFAVDEIRSMNDPVPVQLRIQFVARPEVWNLVKVGDVDASSLVEGRQSAARLMMVGEARNLDGRVSISLDPEPDPNRRQSHSVPQQLVTFDATVSVPVEQGQGSWQFHDQVVKVGAGFSFETAAYTIRGWIIQVTPPGSGGK